LKNFIFFWEFFVGTRFFYEKMPKNGKNGKNAQKCKNLPKNGVYGTFLAKKTVGHHYFFCGFFISKNVLDPKKGPNWLKFAFFRCQSQNCF